MKMIIGGKKVDSSDGKVIEVFNPSTHEIIDTVPSATREDIEKALEIAQNGKDIWANTPLHKRSEILLKYADLVDKHRKELMDISSKEVGKPVIQSGYEIDSLVGLFRGYVEKAKHFYGVSMPLGVRPGVENDVHFTIREPLGVIVCIVPFNFPIVLYAYKAAPALISGNAIIVKPSSDTPMAAIRLIELLLEAGVPESVAQVVTGKGSIVGKWLVSNPKINAVSLTGSTKAGIEIAKEAAQNLHRVFLELGGVMTKDINKAMKVATRIQYGGVVINGSGRYRTLDMAYGGYKMSGLGREGYKNIDIYSPSEVIENDEE